MRITTVVCAVLLLLMVACGGGTKTTPSTSPGPGTSQITGTVLDASTGQPITGFVTVDLETPQPGDYFTVMETTPDSTGRFTFNNVPPGSNYAIAVSASTTVPSYYQPALLVGSFGWPSAHDITPGTDVGAIKLTPPGGSSLGTISIPVTSQNPAAVPTPATVSFTLREFFADRNYTIPFAGYHVSVTTVPVSSCPANTDCATAIFGIPTSLASFNAFQGQQNIPGPFGNNFYTIRGSATISPTNATTDCNPTFLEEIFNAPISAFNNGAPMTFTGCQ